MLVAFETKYSGIIAGIDEAGRGPWAGPVVAAAAIIDKTRNLSGINDSKKLTHAKREKLYNIICAEHQVGVGISSVEEIDQSNILAATKLAMLRAYNNLPKQADIALIDGNQLPKLPCKMEFVVGGDAKSVSIAAASIIAKVTRDRIMSELALQFPEYLWQKNAGYGTAAHQEALLKFGVTEHHRKTYAPIRKLLEN